MSKIEQTIAEIEEYIDNCKFQPLSNSKIVVNRNELEELIDELKQNVPKEIRQYQKIIANRDAILKDAQDKADEMIRKANEMTSQLVSEHEIMQQAYKEANTVVDEATAHAGQILDNATADANAVREAAMRYTDDSLAEIQNILNASIENLVVKHDDLIRSLESSLEVVTRNRRSLEESRRADREAAQSGYAEEYPEYEEPAKDAEVEDRKPLQGDYNDISIEDALDQGVDMDAGANGQEIEDFRLDIDKLNN